MTTSEYGPDDNLIPQRRPLPVGSDGQPAELAELVGLLRQVDVLIGRAVHAAAALDGRRAAAQEGMAVDLAAGLHTGWTRADLNMLLTAADLLGRLPATASLFEAGLLSWGHVRQLLCGVRRFDADRLASVDAQLGSHRHRLAALGPDERTWVVQEVIDDVIVTDSEGGRIEAKIIGVEGEEGGEIAVLASPGGKVHRLPLGSVKEARLAFRI
jgi:hypothetical protein